MYRSVMISAHHMASTQYDALMGICWNSNNTWQLQNSDSCFCWNWQYSNLVHIWWHDNIIQQFFFLSVLGFSLFLVKVTVCLFVCLFVCLPVCLSVHLSEMSEKLFVQGCWYWSFRDWHRRNEKSGCLKILKTYINMVSLLNWWKVTVDQVFWDKRTEYQEVCGMCQISQQQTKI